MKAIHSPRLCRNLFEHRYPAACCGILYFGYMSNRNRQKSIDQVRQLILEKQDSPFEDQGEIQKTDDGLHEDSNVVEFEKKTCCKCGKEMSLWGVNEMGSFSSSEPGWLSRRLESRRNIHGPEPNSKRAS